jgi:hypothetical protein
VIGAVAAGGALGAPPDIPPVDLRGNLSVHLYSFSHHTDQEGVKRDGLDNEVNTGVGLNYAFHTDARGVGFVEAGYYRDSGENRAMLAGIGYQYQLGKRWRLGGALMGVQSDTYYEGRFFVAPLPILTFDFGPVKLNATYIPSIKDYNKYAVFGFYFSLPLAQ